MSILNYENMTKKQIIDELLQLQGEHSRCSAENERQKRINATHLEEHQGLFADNSRLEALVHRLQATSMEQAKSGEKLQTKLDMAEAVIDELSEALVPVSTEQERELPEFKKLGRIMGKMRSVKKLEPLDDTD